MSIKNLLFLMFSALTTALIFSCTTDKSEETPRVPEWAKQAVWYQIFPERFNNGDRNNDPTVEDISKSWPYLQPENWQITPWTSEWYKLQPYEQELPDYNYYQLQGMRRYGGDLQGIIDKLDYLQDLGINAIYLNPIFESPSLHKYDASMYRHVDNNFGPDPAGDTTAWASENPSDPDTWQWTSADKLFLELIKKCHERNIKIIIDGVFNHVGVYFWAFEDIVKNQQNSPYKDWFNIKSWDDPATEINEFDYEGWIGIKSLPEFKEDSTGLIEPVKKHVFNIVKRWMDPNGDGNPEDGIDGWRLDVAEMVSINFWKQFRTAVKDINPDAYITGEIWWEDWQHNKMFNAAPWLQGNSFDAVMNYRFARAVRHFVLRTEDRISSQGFSDSLNNIYRDYDPENLSVLMNLMDSHDVDRLASQINNPNGWYDHTANPGQDENYNVEAPDSIGRMKQKIVVALQMVLPGAPMIYYGDEAGMWGGDDPDCRKPMVWQELTYEDETVHPFGKKRNRDQVKFESGLFDWYKKLISIRRSSECLNTGSTILKPVNDDVILVSRSNNNEQVITIINSSDQLQNINAVQLDGMINGEAVDLITNSAYRIDNDNPLELQPYQTLIFKK